MSGIKLTEYLRDSLSIVAASEGFKNYELKVDQGSSIGDGFVGIIYKVTIQEINESKKLDVVLKYPPLDKSKRNELHSMILFQREVFVYNELFPALEKLQSEKNIEESKGFYNFPKCYFAEYNEEKDDSVIIMEDLKVKGCKMWDKYVPVNLEHTKLLVEALGRFHALSFALKVQKPEIFKKFKNLKDLLTEEIFIEGEFGVSLFAAIKRVAETLDEDDVENKNKVLSLDKENVKDLCAPENSEPYAVVGHGDCWTNNFLFHYDGESVKKIFLLDWQTARYASPVLDLVYFLFSCIDEDMRAEHYGELLEVYYQSLKELLDSLGGDTDVQFPYSALNNQLERFGRFGIVMASLAIPGITTRNEEFVKKPTAETGKSAMKELMESLAIGNDTTKQKLRVAVKDAISYGYFK